MKTLTRLILDDIGSSKEIRKHEFVIAPGKICRGISLHFTGKLNKSDGGTTTLSADDVIALLAHFTLDMEVGPDSNIRKPYNQVGLDRLHMLMREAYQADPVSFGTIAASGDTAFDFRINVPTGMFHKIPELRRVGMGRSQCQSVLVRIKRAGALPTLPDATTTTLKAATAVNVDVQPDLISGNDEEIVVPEFKESEQVGRVLSLDDGFPLLLLDRNDHNNATDLKQATVTVDGEDGIEHVHELASPTDILAEADYAPVQGTEFTDDDDDTTLYLIKNESTIQDAPTGKLKFEQPNGELATIKYTQLLIPAITEDEWKARAKFAAEVSETQLRAVTNWAAKGYAAAGMPSRFSPFLGVSYFPEGSIDYENWFGLAAYRVAGGAFFVDLLNPKAHQAAAQAQVAHLKQTNQEKAATKVVQQASASVPGGIVTGSGFSKSTSSVYTRMKLALKAA